MVSALKKGQFMCLLVDQKLREGMVAPFFGRDATTSISYIKLAIRKKVPVLHCIPSGSGCRFRVTISRIPLPDVDDDASILKLAQRNQWHIGTMDQTTARPMVLATSPLG